MENPSLNISRRDIVWSYLSTILKIGGGVFLLPLILIKLSSDEVGIWSIFIAITSIVGLLDLGFAPSFTRNVTYVFSGVKSLKKNGFDNLNDDGDIDFKLFADLLISMRSFYLWLSIFIFVLLSFCGTFYISFILKSYSGDQKVIYLSWFILCFVNTYNMYSMYYESLLLGRGFIFKSKQFTIIGQLAYLFIASILVYFNFGLISIVSSQLASVIIIRYLSKKYFFDKSLKNELAKVVSDNSLNVFRTIAPNAIKIGLTSFGGYLVNKSPVIIGSFFLPLSAIGSYGISMQIIAVINSLSGIYFNTNLPRIINYRISNNYSMLKEVFIKIELSILGTYIFGMFGVLILGNYAFLILKSNTTLLPKSIFCFAILVSMLEANHSICANILLTKNEVPFFFPSLISGILVILFMLILLKYFNSGVLGLIIGQALVQGAYQNWKWPYEVMKDFRFFKRSTI